jgi:hypothetical protein
MKRIFFYTGLVVAALATGCTKDFDEINTDPTQTPPSNFNSEYFLAGSQRQYIDGITGYNGAILFQSGWVQIFASTSSGAANYYSNMDKYVASGNTRDYSGRGFDLGYKSARVSQELINNLSKDPDKVNVVSAATVMKVLAVHYVTDLYGDVPYSQALQASTNVTQPAYDKQQDVYNSLLSDLDAALSKFDASKAKPAADLFFGGDIARWKKFGYSLMLRIAMRLTKADAATAQKYAEKAAAGGTLSAVSEDVYVKGDNTNGYRSENSRALTTPADFYQVRWSKTLIEFLKGTNDPRVPVIAEVPLQGLDSNTNVKLSGNNTYAKQLGLPHGWDMNGGATDITNSPGYPGYTIGPKKDTAFIGNYSRPRIAIYDDLNSPQFILTYAESELLLAEAKARGWNVGATTAAQHYANGLLAGIQSLAAFNSGDDAVKAALSSATTYVAANPLNVTSLTASLKMINEQYWATTGMLMNFVEAWNNWKRSGYPVLTPVNYAGNFSQGVIPRRQLYPTTEPTANPSNYKTAVTSLTAGDNWNSKTWWDK